jgi:uncharacterized protein YdhG (YjbR/CyaY superfamily)
LTYEANTPEEYIAQLPVDRKVVVQKLREIIKKNLPRGFEEDIKYKMLEYYVPNSIYQNGYHCNPKLPFINIASQKNSVNIYHSGIYAKPALQKRFVNGYPKHCNHKLDISKSCIRFKKINDIPYNLIEELCSKLTVNE